jgi:hypothetical protein
MGTGVGFVGFVGWWRRRSCELLVLLASARPARGRRRCPLCFSCAVMERLFSLAGQPRALPLKTKCPSQQARNANTHLVGRRATRQRKRMKGVRFSTATTRWSHKQTTPRAARRLSGHAYWVEGWGAALASARATRRWRWRGDYHVSLAPSDKEHEDRYRQDGTDETEPTVESPVTTDMAGVKRLSKLSNLIYSLKEDSGIFDYD